MNNNSRMPAVAWLWMTDYMHGWMQMELGGELKILGQRVISVQHLAGVRDIMRMETGESSLSETVQSSMSSTFMNCIEAGLQVDKETVKEKYGLTEESIRLYVPVECPKMYVNSEGVIRPWTLDIGFSQRQASALQRILRAAFWNAVETFDKEYAATKGGAKYTAVEMIEAFCLATKTPDMYVDAMRREWQRRAKRKSS